MASTSKGCEGLKTHKLVVVGACAVGKSALTIQFFQKTFVEDYDPTIEDSYLQHTDIDGERCILDVLDTAGQEEFSALREQYMRGGDGFMIVYSVTDSASFDKVDFFREMILRVKDKESFPIVMVANKIDLTYQRCITESQGIEKARELNIPYLETSAKTPPVNVDKAFMDIVRLIREQGGSEQPQKVKRNRKSCCSVA